MSVVATDAKRRWIDHVALGADGAVALVGRQGGVRQPRAAASHAVSRRRRRSGGLAFAPKGLRLAIAHYNGVDARGFRTRQAQAGAARMEGLAPRRRRFSPDGRFLVTAMQEPMLHGWRLVDGKHMRMSGYTAKVRSMSWSARRQMRSRPPARDELILWPFQGKDGPMGSEPAMPARRSTASSPRSPAIPARDIVAVGYEDGTVLLVRSPDGAEILARRPDGNLVSALAWNAAGTRLAFATEAGEAGVAELGA